ncbi:hypothetical protein MICRO8M_130094 [Microbacterium sp. 8M]|nr:hypothetical protein MICRO8M_130094 [Microbacterium sp. 8M]
MRGALRLASGSLRDRRVVVPGPSTSSGTEDHGSGPFDKLRDRRHAALRERRLQFPALRQAQGTG